MRAKKIFTDSRGKRAIIAAGAVGGAAVAMKGAKKLQIRKLNKKATKKMAGEADASLDTSQ